MKIIFLAIGLMNLVGMATVFLGKEDASVQKNQDNKNVAVNNFAAGLRKAS